MIYFLRSPHPPPLCLSSSLNKHHPPPLCLSSSLNKPHPPPPNLETIISLLLLLDKSLV